MIEARKKYLDWSTYEKGVSFNTRRMSIDVRQYICSLRCRQIKDFSGGYNLNYRYMEITIFLRFPSFLKMVKSNV